MTGPIYCYDDPGGRAALHLIDHSALRHTVVKTQTIWANDTCIRVDLDTPMPSTGERALWRCAESLVSSGGLGVSLFDLAEVLDVDSRIAVAGAVDVLMANPSEVTA